MEPTECPVKYVVPGPACRDSPTLVFTHPSADVSKLNADEIQGFIYFLAIVTPPDMTSPRSSQKDYMKYRIRA